MKRKSGCASQLTAIGLLFAVVIGASYLGGYLDRQRFPWGYADSGAKTLVGTWVGPVTTGSGKRLGMLVEIELAPLGAGRRRGAVFRTRRSRWLEGRVEMCDGPGRLRRLTASGKPDDGTASRFRLAMSAADSVPQPDGLTPSHIRGRWDGGDSIALDASLYMRRGKSAISNSADPDTGRDTPVTLKRGTEAEFESLCGRL